MDGVDFFSTALKSVSFDLPPAGDGVCAIHRRPATLYKYGNDLVCRGCILLRQTYPIRLKNNVEGRTRLGLGCYMLISKHGGTHYWGKHSMPEDITVHAASGAIREVGRELILNPPQPPWMFIAFARANAPDRLAVTTTNDLLRFSGKFYMPGTVDQPQVERLNRKWVMGLHEAADLTRQEWEKVARAHAALLGSAEALAYLRDDVYRRYPALAKLPIPSERTPEYNAVRLIARDK